jgi:Protein of unknown function (DUF2946)
MDEIVLRAIQKWPNVPAVYGWLGLDRRGNWSIKGERVANPGITTFIGRNYARDDKGRWFFQNGPQRVFVTLAYTPLVYRTQRDPAGGLSLIAHTGTLSVNPCDVFLDENGALLAHTELGVGLVHDQDLPELLMCLLGPSGEPLQDSAIEQLLADRGQTASATTTARLRLGTHAVPVSFIRSPDVAVRFGFDPDPRPAPGEPEC